MAKTAKETEIKYHDKLNISVMSISKVKQLIKNDIMDTLYSWQNGNINMEKQCYHIIGPAGVGKTQICEQICQELTQEVFIQNNIAEKEFEFLMVKSPVLNRDDFIIPFPVVTNEDPSFKMLYSDFIPKMKNSFGLFVIDEFSRGDHQLQQLLWQVLNEYSVHRHNFPKGWFVVSTDNPDDQEYSMDNLEDAAGLRRQLHVYVEVNAKDFLDYAITQKFHPLIIEFIQTHPEYLYDFQSQKLGAVYANPASYEKLSSHITKMIARRGSINFDEIEIKASGLLNASMASRFISFAKEQKDINPKDVFFKFPMIKPQILALIKENNNAKLAELMNSFCTYMSTSMPKYKEAEINNVIDFLLTMPIDTAALFITQIDTLDRSDKAFEYISGIHTKMYNKSERYVKEFYEALMKISESRT